MKLKFIALAFAAAAALTPLTTRAEDEVSFEVFYDNLSPYGDWIEVGDYGTCWHPTGVDADWAPYTDGYWSYTDAGWTWVSYEDFGDITYHYGRWVDVDDVGWCWVPDNEWGPAWVSWRQDDEYIGWAPLPPEAHWRSSVGFSVWVDDHYDIGPSYYNFCPIVEFSAPVIRHVCVPRVAVINIFARSVNITNISWNGYHHVPFCGGPNFTVFNTRLHRPIPTFKLVQNNTIINNNVTIINNRRVVKFPRANVAGNTLNVFAPKVVNKNVTNFKPNIKKVVQKDKVNRGWKLQNQNEVAKLRQKVKSEAKGLNPDTAPAKPVQVADLKPLPEKADPTAPSPIAGRGDRRGDRDGNDNRPGRGNADRPGKGQGVDEDRPGKVAGDRPGKGQDNDKDRPAAGADDKPKKVAGDTPGRGNGADRENNRPGGNNPVVRPFNEDRGDRGAGQGGGREMGKQRQGADNDDGGKAERQRQAQEQLENVRQQRAAEARQRQMEAQRNAAEQAERRQRPEVQRPQVQRQEVQRDQVERQQQLQRQAELQQRQLQIQRQQQLQRQQQMQRQVQRQQPQQLPPQQIQRQQVPRQQNGGNQGQGQGQGQGRGQGGQKLSPEERAALQKQRGF